MKSKVLDMLEKRNKLAIKEIPSESQQGSEHKSSSQGELGVKYFLSPINKQPPS